MSFFKLILSIFLVFSIASENVFALDVPTLTGPVVDQTRFLSEPGSRTIASALYNLEQKTGIQFQVLIISKLQNESLEGYSIKVVDQWKIGKKGDDRAALFLIVADDHKMRIEVGRGLEGSLTDLKTRRILKEVKPLLKSGNNDNGVALGLSLMAQSAGSQLSFEGNNIQPRHARKTLSSSFLILILFGLIIFLQYVFPNGGGRGGRGGFGGGGFGGFGGGGFGGGSGGGGGWSGGGGGFSGGGSSGDW
ncbi:MAG: TPM domain-containing protein [Bacteriovorax sp.]|nr:TPM domain-containing protein [Bacteriovorax sp.]